MNICIIGNSFIGAMLVAYKKSEKDPAVNLDFYGAGGTDFLNILVEDDTINNAKFTSTDRLPRISEYDIFYIYGRLPCPHDLIKIEEDLTALAYSLQFTEDYMADYVSHSKAVTLAKQLRKLTTKKIFIIPSNVNMMTLPKSLTELAVNTKEELIKSSIGEVACYFPVPAEFLDGDYLPVKSFYQNSLGLEGKPAGHHANHDMVHMNDEGGGVLLRQVIRIAKETQRGL